MTYRSHGLAVLFKALYLVLVHLLTNEQEHVCVRFFKRRSGLCYTINPCENSTLVELRLSGGVFQACLFLLKRLVAKQNSALIRVEYTVHLLFLVRPETQ